MLEARLEALSDYGVSSEEEMSPTLIGTESDTTDKVTKDKSVNEEKETADSKVDNFE